VLRETTKFPKHGFLDGTFEKWLHKATLWSHVNAYPSEALNFLSLKRLQTNIHHIVIGGGGVETMIYHYH